MKALLQTTLILCLSALALQPLIAEEQQKPAEARPHHAGQAFLGVLVSSVHPALASNLSELLSPEQGLIVEDLAANSPARKAGIQAHDILTAYDNQKLFSAEQLAKLVHGDKPGREVTVEFLRGRKLQTAKVKLGESKNPQPRAWPPPTELPHQFALPDWIRRPHVAQPPNGSEWEDFDSLTLKNLGDNRLRAEVQYLDKAGKTRKHAFEGTREEIRKAVEAEKELRPAERKHLLRSLNMSSIEEEFWGPEAWFGP